MTHRQYMEKAVALAKKALRLGEVPVGAVVVKDGLVIGEGYNRRQTDNDAVAHAEIIAIQNACRRLGSWRLDGRTLYVTLEPCPMCAGAVINSRISTVVYSLIDFKGGAMGGRTDLGSMGFNHRPEVIMGVCEDESRRLMEEFFKNLRQKGESEP